MSARCEKTDLLVEQCAHCRSVPDPQIERRREHTALLSEPGWFEARFGDECARCGEPFDAGTPIHSARFLRMGSEGWIGPCCAEAWDQFAGGGV